MFCLDNETFPRTLIMSRLSRFCHLELGSSESVTSSLEICSGDLKSDATYVSFSASTPGSSPATPREDDGK